MRISLARAAALLLAVLCTLSLFGCNTRSDVPLSPGLSMVRGEPIYDKGVAMRTDHFTITEGMMAYFFYTVGGKMMPEMEAQKPYDEKKTLHDQQFTDTLTWYDAIMNATLEQVTQLLMYCEAASAAGVSLDEKGRASVEALVSDYRMQGAMNYSMGLEEYLQSLYGPSITEQDLVTVLEMEMLANSYSLTVRASLEEGVTDAAVEAYIEEKGIADHTRSRNIALLYVAYGANGEPSEKKVSAALDALRLSPTVQTVESLTEYGTPARENNLTPDSTGIEPIARWLFDAERRVGDVGRVETAGATYVLLYCADGVSYGEVAARRALFDIAFAEWYNARVSGLTFGYNYTVLDSYDIQK